MLIRKLHAPDGPGGDAGGGVPDTTLPVTPVEPAEPIPPLPGTPPGPTNGEGRTFTQLEAGRLIAAARKEGREQALREAQTPEPPATPPPTRSTGKQSKDEMRLTLDFRDAIADYGIPRAKRSQMEDMFLHSGQQDADKWVSGFMEAFDMRQEQTPAQPDGTPAPTVPPPTGPPASDRGGPAGRPDELRADNPLTMTQSEVQRIIDSAETPEAGIQAVRKKFMGGLKNYTLTFPRNGTKEP